MTQRKRSKCLSRAIGVFWRDFRTERGDLSCFAFAFFITEMDPGAFGTPGDEEQWNGLNQFLPALYPPPFILVQGHAGYSVLYLLKWEIPGSHVPHGGREEDGLPPGLF